MQTSRLIQLGLAIFAMLFGAGNVVYPLCLGRDAGSMVMFAVAGFIVTGVVVPLIGLVSAALFNGDYKKFLGMAGRWPGAIIAFMCMLLLGPLGATPRCITLAHGAAYWHLPFISLFVFSVITAALIFAATIRRNMVVELMGRVFGPIKLVLLFIIIVLGLVAVAAPLTTALNSSTAFARGFADGYLTLDLIGTIFFSALIIGSIRASMKPTERDNQAAVAWYGLKAGVIGGTLLGLVYIGFSFAAAKQGLALADIDRTLLLSALAEMLLGARASWLANLTTAIACLSTAIALTAVFAEYLASELFGGRIKYMHALAATVVMNLAMTNLGFTGLMHVTEPLVVICYPALIVLSVANAAHVFWGFNYIKEVVIGTLVINIIVTAMKHTDAIKAALAQLIG
ncbi:hypothetical protein FJ365_00025 [Candidatus Dependentiae bacterium]|nr:hypothetical protein [Candidatus Dependentiae bacterium]